MDMEDKKNDAGKVVDDLILPGFRFHPTDEELVGFYLTRKVHQCSFPIELIKQVDIYKYDPWDLPKLASTGEKEWYFYSSRDRKYRNSTRPNRVTRSGFWKATGTDRPIYSSEGSNCIGLKKSLVFYFGKAAKGSKTDWMMHEFRLPSLQPSSTPMLRKSSDNSPSSCQLNDSWAICRIFKKAKIMAQRGVSSQSWESSSPAATMEGHDDFSPKGSAQLCCPPNSTAAFTSPLDFPTSYSYHHKPMNVPPPTPTCSIRPMPHFSVPTSDFVSTNTTTRASFFPPHHLFNGLSTGDDSTEKLPEGGDVRTPQFSGGISVSLQQGIIMQGKMGNGEQDCCYLMKMNPYSASQPQWSSAGSTVGFGLGLPSISSIAPHLPWDSSPHLTEMTTSYASN